MTTIKIRILDYIHRPCVYFYKFTKFRRLALSPSSGEGNKEGLVYMNTRIEKIKSKKRELNWTKMQVLHSWVP
jgi:hypothetical protein